MSLRAVEVDGNGLDKISLPINDDESEKQSESQHSELNTEE